jgi:predicted RecB family nuclease
VRRHRPRVETNLLDLLPVTREAIALPLPSYSLKVIEHYIGFRRTQDEYGGAWSMATFIEADATWAVLEWLRAKH